MWVGGQGAEGEEEVVVVVVEEEEAEAVCGSHQDTHTCVSHTVCLTCETCVGALQTPDGPDGNSLMLSPWSVWEAECHGGGGGGAIHLIEGGREGDREGDSYWAAVRPRCVACGSVLERGMQKAGGPGIQWDEDEAEGGGGRGGGLGEKKCRQ